MTTFAVMFLADGDCVSGFTVDADSIQDAREFAENLNFNDWEIEVAPMD